MRPTEYACPLYRAVCLKQNGTVKYAGEYPYWNTDPARAKLFTSSRKAQTSINRLTKKYNKEMPRPSKGYMEHINSQYIIEEIEIVIINREFLQRRNKTK